MAPSGALCSLISLFITLSHHLTDAQLTDALFPVRALGGLSTTSFFTFDFDFQLPLQIADLNMNLEVDVEVPFRIRFMNHSLEYHAIKIPYFVLPEPKPLTFDLSGDDYKTKPQKYYHYETDPYSYESDIDQYDSNYYEDAPRRSWFSLGGSKSSKKAPKKKPIQDEEYYRKYKNYGSMAKKRNDHKKNTRHRRQDEESQVESGQVIDDDVEDVIDDDEEEPRHQNFTMDTLRFYHRRHRRDVAAASVQHRQDFFQVIEDTLDTYGLEGRQCVCRAICEMAEMEFLIETPMHEIVEHLLRVSRAHDSEGNLSDYLDAEHYGHESYEKNDFAACSKRYKECPFSIFNRFHHG